MATNSVSTQASCKLCSEHFTDPRMLPCLHSFCFNCLVKNFDDAKSDYACPTCNEPFELPDGNLNSLTKDLHATYVAEVSSYEKKLTKKGEVYCDRCIASSDNVAIKFCCNCCKFLCSWCTKDHKRREKTHKHELVDVGEKKDDQYERGLLNSIPHKVMNCQKHDDEVLKFYCTECRKLICRDCITLWHSGHSYDRIEPIAEEEKSQLLPLVTDANTASSKLDDAVATSGKVVQNIAMRQKAVDNEIRNCFKKLHDALKDRERSLLALSSQVGAGKTTALKMQSEEMKLLNDKITQVSRLMTEASDSYTPAEMLSAKDLLTDKLDSLMKQYKACSLDPCKNESIHTDFDNHTVMEVIENFGVVIEGCYANTSTASLYIPWAINGKEKRVTVVTRDFRGDLFQRGGDVVKARLTPSGSNDFVDGVVDDKGDGTYEVSVTPLSAGKHELSITIGNEPIVSSPFEINVWEQRDYSKLSCQQSYKVATPMDVAISDNNEMFVVSYNNHNIHVVNLDDGSTRSIGTRGNGELQFESPSAIAIHSGMLYVTEGGNHRIQKLTLTGEHVLTFGSNGTGESQFKLPRGICFDLEGKIYVSEGVNNRVSVFQSDWTFDHFITEKLQSPWGITFDNSGNLIVADNGSNTFEVFSPEGKHIGSYGSGQLIFTSCVAVDPEGYIFVSEYNTTNSRLRVFDAAYQVQESTIKGFNCLAGIKFSKDGSIFVADRNGGKVQKF